MSSTISKQIKQIRKFDNMIITYINDNLTLFMEEVRKLHKATLISFIGHLYDNYSDERFRGVMAYMNRTWNV